MVPEGWIEGRVTDLIKALDAGVSVNSEDDGNLFSDFKILKTSCVSNGFFDRREVKSVVDKKEQSRLRESLLSNTIVLSRMNTPALVGANAYIEESDNSVFLPDRLWQAKAKSKSVVMKWLAYWFSSQHTRYILSRLGTGTSGTMKNITKPDVLSIRLSIPPRLEQKKISRILLTWDRAIEVTEKLIYNSQKQKKSLMQQLLTGKKRLPGFREKWKLKTIGSICSAFSGGTPSRTKEEYYGGTIPWITSGKVNDRFIYSVSEYITDEGLKNSSAKCVERNNILVAMYGATAGKVAINMIDGATINQAILALIPNVNCFDLFMFYLLEREMIKALNLVQGGQPNLNASIIKSIKVEIPHLKEQQKIASVLSTADKEIETLQQKLECLKEEKKALMQQLLTGKRRVKIDEDDIHQKGVVNA